MSSLKAMIGNFPILGRLFSNVSGSSNENVYSAEEFDQKTVEYAQGHDFKPQGYNQKTDWISYALRGAVDANDIDYIEQALQHDDAQFQFRDGGPNIHFQDALCHAIVTKNLGAVRVMLENGVAPEASNSLPAEDAVFVAATGVRPKDFDDRLESGLWQSGHVASPVDRDIFREVFSTVKDKYGDDRHGFVSSMQRGFTLPKTDTGYIGDELRGIAGHRSASILGGARVEIQDIIAEEDPELWANRDRMTHYLNELKQKSDGQDVLPS